MAERPYSSQKHSKKPQVASEQQFVETLLQAIWNLLKFLFGKKGGSSPATSQQLKQLATGWEQVEMYAMQPAAHALAVSEADKILDSALRLKGVAGITMGERLKNSQKLFPGDLYQRIWEAHKLRNALAHEVGASVDAGEVQQAVTTFRSALYQLGIL